MDEQTREGAAKAYYAADAALIGWRAGAGMVIGIVLTVVGALIDLRSGVVGTLIIGIVVLVAGICFAIFGRRLRAIKRRQIGHLFQVDQDRL